MGATDAAFKGSIPLVYEQYLAPLIFEPFAEDLAGRVTDIAEGRILETAAGTGIVTRAMTKALPSQVEITATDLPNSTLIGQFPRPNTVTEFFGLVLEKNSPMTACASAAVDALYADGTLDQLAQTWLADTAGVPVLA